MPVTKYEDVPLEERQLWEGMLTERGLSPEAGTTSLLSYGWNHSDWTDQQPFNYSLEHKPAEQRGGIRLSAGKKALCVKHISPRCKCSTCVNLTAKSNHTIRENVGQPNV